VATARRPDVLIVDEALSVGDTYFQHKSFDRIREFRKSGTTLLIVSHSAQSIQTLCDHAILLDAGRLAMQGEPEAVMDYYNAMLAERGNQTVRQQTTAEGKVQTISGNGESVIESVVLQNEQGERLEVVGVGQQILLKVVVRTVADVPELVVGYLIKDRLGQPVFGTNTHHMKRKLEAVKGGQTFTLTFRFTAGLAAGTYSVAVALHTTDTHVSRNYEWRDHALIFNVVNFDKEYFVGVAWLPPSLEYVQ
jgi:lipopolysaccharide transport system ATP-binding protein